MKPPFAVAVVCTAVCILLGPAAAAKSTEIEIKPGPTAMSPVESALEPDRVAGTEHAEILVFEIERDEDYGADALLHFHLRAKIHSLEGRELADIEIPYRANYDRIMRWWGRTIQPDGSLHELTEEQLEQQLVTRVGSGGVNAAKAALPGVIPGCVIDYGFTLRLDSAYIPYTEISLQRSFRIDYFRYRWKPSRFLSAAYRVRQTDGLDVSLQRDKNSVLIVAKDVPPIAIESMMPPPDALSATVILYYFDPSAGTKEYWSLQAKRVAGKERPSEEVLKAVASIGLDPAKPLESRLRDAFDWTLRRITNTSLLSVEEIEIRAFDDDPAERATVLARGEGSGRQIDRLFADVARAVGAEAHLVLATDRRRRLWDRDLLSMAQFTEMLVAVRDPSGPESNYTLLAPGSSLSYGEVPWWVTGADALLTDKSGAGWVFVPPGPAAQNVRETRATVRFGEQGLPGTASWSVRSTGQTGREDERWLRRVDPEARRRRLDDLCGAGPSVEVERAEAPDLEDARTDLRLECEIELTDLVLDRSYDHFRYDARGPWIDALPHLPPGERVHPVVFDYPFAELLELDIHAPPGMEPGTVPDPVRLDSPFGRYQREVARVEGAFHVERKLAIVALAVPPTEYEALRGFHEQVALADAAPLVFVRRAEP